MGLALAGSTTGASAHYRHHRHCCGGPVAPSYSYGLTHSVRHVTRYRDVSRTRYVQRIHRIVHVTRVQPIVYVRSVTRIHHHTVSYIRPVHERFTEYLPVRTIMTSAIVNTYDCVCRGRSRRRCR
jgi:hypothetical protein